MEHLSINDYEINQQVEVKIRNIETGRDEWREAKIVRDSMIYPNRGERHSPYRMLFVEVIRTYFKITDSFTTVSNGHFYDKLNIEGIIYSGEIRTKT